MASLGTMTSNLESVINAVGGNVLPYVYPPRARVGVDGGPYATSHPLPSGGAEGGSVSLYEGQAT
jgi:hypothetical protein